MEKTPEEAAKHYSKDPFVCTGFLVGAKWQQERMYSEEEVKDILIEYLHYLTVDNDIDVDKWFEQFKK